MRMADIMAFTVGLTKDLNHTGKIWGREVSVWTPCSISLLLNFGPTQHQSAPPQKVAQKLITKKRKKRHTTFFPGCCFSEWHFVEGGKVIKGFGLEKPFYFSSYWADVNKDVVNVNNDLINQSRWQCQEELESKSRLHPRVIKLDYTLNN